MVVILVGSTTVQQAFEKDFQGAPISPNPTAVTWVVADTGIATVAVDEDGVATFTGVAKGQTSVLVTDTATGIHATFPVVVSEPTPVPTEPVSISIGFPVPSET